MSNLNVTFDVPDPIVRGIENGTYERVGGVVRETQSKQIVGWLREVADPGPISILDNLTALSSVAAVASALNLGVSTMGFSLVLNRVKFIEEQLKESQALLQAIDYKIDISFYANFRAGLDLAMNAFTMVNPETRRLSAMQAINRFLEAEHQYAKLADVEIENKSQVADEYVLTLSLAYVTEARCYLELEELQTAQRRLQEGIAVLRPRFEKLIQVLLTPNPAAYLHPSLKDQISLRRLTKIYQWLNPEISEMDVFEAQRDNLFRLAQQPREWVDSLPQAIRIPKPFFSKAGVMDLAKESSKKITGIFPKIPRGLPGFKSDSETVEEDEPAVVNADAEVYSDLPEVMGLIETLMENSDRLEMYQAELQTVIDQGITFQEWRELTPTTGKPINGNNLMYIAVQ